MLSEAVVMETSNEWTAACEVQQRFMRRQGPATDFPDSSGRCRQVRELGGDCYDFVPLAHDRLALFVGDASGKGLAAALMISNVQSSLRTAASFAGDDGPAVMRAVNRQVYESSLADRYATVFYGIFDRATRTLRYVNAGHPPAMVIRRDGSTLWLETGGAPAGMFPDWIYEEGVVQLQRGDMLIAYTDGVIEAVNPHGEEWGLDGFGMAALESRGQGAKEMVESIFTSMDEFSRGYQTDDATVAAFEVD